MLNPSTADARRNDPTVRRCIGYAQDWGYDALEVVNIFALRSTDPKALVRDASPIGPRNDLAIQRAASRAEMVVAAWGAHGRVLQRGREVLWLLSNVAEVRCLAVTRCGQPAHPLYLARTAQPKPIPEEMLVMGGAPV